jgi:hypothetical protein
LKRETRVEGERGKKNLRGKHIGTQRKDYARKNNPTMHANIKKEIKKSPSPNVLGPPCQQQQENPRVSLITFFLTFSHDIVKGTIEKFPLLIRCKVGFVNMFNHLGGIALDHPSDPWQRDRPHRTQFAIIFQKEGVQQFGTGYRGHEERVAQERDRTLWLFEVVATTGSNGMRAVFVGEEGDNGGDEFEFVGVGGGGGGNGEGVQVDKVEIVKESHVSVLKTVFVEVMRGICDEELY